MGHGLIERIQQKAPIPVGGLGTRLRILPTFRPQHPATLPPSTLDPATTDRWEARSLSRGPKGLAHWVVQDGLWSSRLTTWIVEKRMGFGHQRLIVMENSGGWAPEAENDWKPIGIIPQRLIINGKALFLKVHGAEEKALSDEPSRTSATLEIRRPPDQSSWEPAVLEISRLVKQPSSKSPVMGARGLGNSPSWKSAVLDTGRLENQFPKTSMAADFRNY